MQLTPPPTPRQRMTLALMSAIASSLTTIVTANVLWRATDRWWLPARLVTVLTLTVIPHYAMFGLAIRGRRRERPSPARVIAVLVNGFAVAVIVCLGSGLDGRSGAMTGMAAFMIAVGVPIVTIMRLDTPAG